MGETYNAWSEDLGLSAASLERDSSVSHQMHEMQAQLDRCLSDHNMDAGPKVLYPKHFLYEYRAKEICGERYLPIASAL